MPQRILDLAALPVLDVQRVLLATVDQFRPTLLVFSWRDIQIMPRLMVAAVTLFKIPLRSSMPAIP